MVIFFLEPAKILCLVVGDAIFCRTNIWKIVCLVIGDGNIFLEPTKNVVPGCLRCRGRRHHPPWTACSASSCSPPRSQLKQSFWIFWLKLMTSHLAKQSCMFLLVWSSFHLAFVLQCCLSAWLAGYLRAARSTLVQDNLCNSNLFTIMTNYDENIKYEKGNWVC